MAYINNNEDFLVALKGDSAFIRYSADADADGADFTEEWSEGQNYIGFATGQTAPTDKSGYTWVLLPEGKAQTQAKPLARVTIDKELNFFVQWDKDEPMQIEGIEELTAFLFDCREKDEEMYIALYADATIPYGEVVKVLNIANDNEFKMVLATRQPDKKR